LLVATYGASLDATTAAAEQQAKQKLTLNIADSHPRGLSNATEAGAAEAAAAAAAARF
jgi:hypothetical protein